jgi:uncharacterized cupin superfamily protein
MTADAPYVIERADVSGYEPMLHQGAEVGEMFTLKPEGVQANALDAGLWRSDPGTYDYLFEGDEAFVVLEGAATIDLPDSGESVEVTQGDIAYFAAGTRSVWTITKPFKKFVVVPS